MTERNFSLDGHDYIELSNLLKVINLVNSGGEAKIRITEGEAHVNGEVELRKRKKLRVGDIVIFGGQTIKIAI